MPLIIHTPWLLAVFILYNVTTLTAGADMAAFLAAPFVSIPLLSGVSIDVSRGEAFVIFTMLMLFAELVKSSRNSTMSIVDHALSFLLFTVALVQFVSVKSAATSTYAIFVTACLLDVIAGFWISIRFARRDISVNEASVAT